MSGASPTVVLRPTHSDDLPAVVAAERHPDNADLVLPWSEDEHRAALRNEDVAHRVVQTPDGVAVGFVMLAGRQSPHMCIEFRRVVIWEKGRGYGRAAVQAVQQWAFEEHGAHRLWLDVMEHNHRARALYARAGFVVEGTLRECLRGPDGWRSLVVMSQLATAWQRSGDVAAPVVIRRGNVDDVPALVRLNQHVHEPHIFAEPTRYRETNPTELAAWFRERLARSNMEVALALADDRPVGFALVSWEDRPESPFGYAERVAVVDQLVVESDRQGAGIGRALLEYVEARAREEGCVRLELDVREHNVRARGFYEAVGYRTLARRMGRELV